MPRDSSRAVMEATESFHCEINGQRFTVMAGETRVAADDELVLAYPDKFKALGISFPEDEQATNAPGESRTRQTRTREVPTDA